MSSLFRSSALLEASVPPSDIIVNVTGAVYEFSNASANQYRWSAASYEFSQALVSASFNIGLRSEVNEFSFAFTYGNTNPAMTAGIRVVSSANAVAQVDRPILDENLDCCFFFPYNRWSDRSLGTITASSQITMYPASNTQLPQRSKVWRSDAQTSAYISRDLGSAYRINSIVLVSHNATNTGQFRVRVSNSATFATTLYDSGYVKTWEPSFATTGIASEFADSNGRPTNATIELLRYCSENARTARWLVFPEVAARYIRIDFLDPDQVLGWNELAYVYAGLCVGIQPDQLYGWTLGFETVNRIRIAASGKEWIDDLHKKVTAQATFAGRPSDQALAFWYWLEQKLGMAGEFIICFQPENLPTKRFWFTIYCHMTNLPDLENIGFKTYNISQFEVEELL